MRILILLMPWILIAEEFIITYKIATRDHVILNETYHVSHAMVSDNWTPADQPCEIFDERDFNSTKEALHLHKEAVLQCLFGFGVKLRNDGITFNNRSTSVTTLRIPPTQVHIEADGGVLHLWKKPERGN